MALLLHGILTCVAGIVVIPLALFRGKLEEPEAVQKEREELRRKLETGTPEERAEAEAELEDDILAEEPEKGLLKARLAFGPFLILATLERLLADRDLLESYLSWINSL